MSKNENTRRKPVKSDTSSWSVRWKYNSVHERTGEVISVIIARPPGGVSVTVRMKPAELASIDAVRKVQNATGVLRNADNLKHRLARLVEGGAKAQREATYQSGWHGGRFVTPTRTLRFDKSASRIDFDPDRVVRTRPLAAPGLVSGTIEEWKSSVAAIAWLSTVGIVVVAAALAAPLLKFAGLSEAFLALLFGKSTGGKTALTQLGMSVQGKAARDLIVPVNMTPRGLEDLAPGFNHLLMPFDDLGRVSDKAKLRAFVAWLIHQFSDGGGRLVGDGAQQAGLTLERYASIGLVSSERSSAEIAAEAGEVRQRGEEARLFDIDCAGDVFDRIPDGDGRSGEDLAAELIKGVVTSYGTPLAVFLPWLASQDEEVLKQQVAKLTDAFVDRFASGADNVQRRAARKFGLLYAAVVLATKAGVIDWPRKEVRAAIGLSYQGAMALGVHADDGPALIVRLRKLLAQPGRVLRVDAKRTVPKEAGEWIAVTGVCLIRKYRSWASGKRSCSPPSPTRWSARGCCGSCRQMDGCPRSGVESVGSRASPAPARSSSRAWFPAALTC